MFDIGWQELLVIAVVALIVIGPKDLPVAIRAITRWIARARELARDFQHGIDEVVREAELDELKKQVTQIQHVDVNKKIEETIDPTGEIRRDLALDDVRQELDRTAEAVSSTASTESGPGAEPATPAPEPAPQPTLPAPSTEDATKRAG
jgi:sec-independent protein translocase protein TatB